MILSGTRRLLIITLSVALFLPGEWLLADDLGRLFLTPRQRAKLEIIRNTEPVPEKPVTEAQPEAEIQIMPESTDLPEIVIKEEPVLSGPLVLKGVVKRSDGENTAWVNDSNTYEADPDLEQVEIYKNDIQADGVKLSVPGNVNKITLKVGQVYEPETEKEKKLTDN